MLPGDLISPRKAARILHVHISAIYRWLLSGKLAGYKRAGARWLISEADVKALLVAWGEPAPERVSREAAARAAVERLRQRGYRFGKGDQSSKG